VPGPRLEVKNGLYLHRKRGKVYREAYVRVQDYPTDPDLWKPDYPAPTQEDIQPQPMLAPTDMVFYLKKYEYENREIGVDMAHSNSTNDT